MKYPQNNYVFLNIGRDDPIQMLDQISAAEKGLKPNQTLVIQALNQQGQPDGTVTAYKEYADNKMHQILDGRYIAGKKQGLWTETCGNEIFKVMYKNNREIGSPRTYRSSFDDNNKFIELEILEERKIQTSNSVKPEKKNLKLVVESQALTKTVKNIEFWDNIKHIVGMDSRTIEQRHIEQAEKAIAIICKKFNLEY